MVKITAPKTSQNTTNGIFVVLVDPLECFNGLFSESYITLSYRPKLLKGSQKITTSKKPTIWRKEALIFSCVETGGIKNSWLIVSLLESTNSKVYFLPSVSLYETESSKPVFLSDQW